MSVAKDLNPLSERTNALPGKSRVAFAPKYDTKHKINNTNTTPGGGKAKGFRALSITGRPKSTRPHRQSTETVRETAEKKKFLRQLSFAKSPLPQWPAATGQCAFSRFFAAFLKKNLGTSYAQIMPLVAQVLHQFTFRPASKSFFFYKGETV